MLETALPRIAYLTVVVEPREAKANVTVGGSPVSSALIGVERPTDPGKHEVVATAPGYSEARTAVELAEGARQAVTLKLTLDPNAPVVTPPVTEAPVAPATPAPTDTGRKAERAGKRRATCCSAWAASGSSSAASPGVMALGKKGDLDCPDNTCSGGEADKLDSANTLALVSTIGVGVGVAATAVGVVLWLRRAGTKKHHPLHGWASRDALHRRPSRRDLRELFSARKSRRRGAEVLRYLPIDGARLSPGARS